MFDGKFLCTLTALIVAVVAICNFNPGKSEPVVENWWNTTSLGGAPRTQVLAKNPNGRVSVLQDTYNPTIWNSSTGLATNMASAPGIAGPNLGHRENFGGAKGAEFFQTPGTFQSNLSPRFANTQFGSNIRYNAPAFKNMGVPKSPLGYANMAKENYTPEQSSEGYGCGCGGAGCFAADCAGPARSQSPKSCGAGSAPPQMASAYANGDFNQQLEEAIDEMPASSGFTNTLPIGTMNTVTNMGEELGNVVMYDRLTYANRNSRLYSQGDFIRGDLAITPAACDWFRPSVDPAIDLNPGAMNVLGGVRNETAGQLASLINKTTGWNTIGGVAMSNQELASLGSSGNDINYTAFP
jgi:hypothetical protein